MVLPISHVTSNYSKAEVSVWDGSTYRDNMYADLVEKAQLHVGAGAYVIADDTVATAPNPEPVSSLTASASKAPGIIKTGSYNFQSISDTAAKIPPRFWEKQRTLMSFTRTVSAAAAFTHVVWLDLVQGTSSHPPYRVGMTPPTMS
jgi:hypothetical protein